MREDKVLDKVARWRVVGNGPLGERVAPDCGVEWLGNLREGVSVARVLRPRDRSRSGGKIGWRTVMRRAGFMAV